VLATSLDRGKRRWLCEGVLKTRKKINHEQKNKKRAIGDDYRTSGNCSEISTNARGKKNGSRVGQGGVKQKGGLKTAASFRKGD